MVEIVRRSSAAYAGTRYRGSDAITPLVVAQISGDLDGILDEQIEAVSAALRRGVNRATDATKRDLRNQTERAGLGTGFARSWASNTYPAPGNRRTWRPAGLVYSKATVLADAFDRGPTITPRVGEYLVIPTEAAEARGLATTNYARKGGFVPGGQKRRASLLADAADKLGATVVSTKAGRARAPARGIMRGKKTTGAQILLLPSKKAGTLVAALKEPGKDAMEVLFILVPSVRLPRLLDISRAEEVAATRLNSEINAALDASK